MEGSKSAKTGMNAIVANRRIRSVLLDDIPSAAI